MIQEAVIARTEMTKLQVALRELNEQKVKVEVKDAEVMTETVDGIGQAAELPPQISSSFSSSPQVPSSFFTTTTINTTEIIELRKRYSINI